MGLKEYLRNTSVPVFLAVMVFAIASWIDLNGVWVEVPLMVNALPEGWALPSYLVIITQIANVGPLAYTVAKKLAPRHVQEWWVIYVIIAIGFVACLLLVFFWDETSYVGGEEHSTALLVLTLFLALVDCTSSVVFLPYMAQYTAQYLNALYVGEGLSGLIPGIIGIIQGIGKDPTCVNSTKTDSNGTEVGYGVYPVYDPPLFSVNVFFGILCVLLVMSGTAFTLLHFHPRLKAHKVSRIVIITTAAAAAAAAAETRTKKSRPPPEETPSEPDSPFSASGEDHSQGTTTTVDTKPIPRSQSLDGISSISSSNIDSPSLRNVHVVVQLILIGWLNALSNGVLPSIQSYSCLPYGNLAYNLSVRLSILANPLACFFGLFVRTRSTVAFVVLVVIGTAFSAYHIAMAALSPYPPLYDHTAGVVLVVSTFVLLTAIFSYVKMSIAIVLSHRGGARGLLWCGGVTQVGSCIGAIVIFVLVNVAKLFESKDPCS